MNNEMLNLIPGLAVYVMASGIVSTYCVETIKNVFESIQSKDWSPVIKRGAALGVSTLFVWPSAVAMPDIPLFAGKIVAVIIAASLSSDVVYPVTKKLKAVANTDKPNLVGALPGLSVPNPFGTEEH